MQLGRQTISISALMRSDWMDSEMREHINHVKVEQYAEEKSAGDEFPDPVVFIDGEGNYHVGDGFHRILADLKRGWKFIGIELRRGSFRDAFLHNIEANRNQRGLTIGRGDKKRAVETMLKDAECSAWPYARIAEFVGCSAGFVSTVANDVKIKPRRIQGPREWKNLEVQERRAKIEKLLKSGKSSDTISNRTGFSKSTIQRDVKVLAEEGRLIPCPHCNGTGYVGELSKLKEA